VPADEPPQDDQDLEWTAWRSGPGYSRPVPPDPEAGAGPAKPGSHEKPAPRHPYQGRVPGQAHPSERRDEFWGPKHSAEPSSAPHVPPPEVHEEPRSRTAPRTYEPRAYQAPSPYEEPEGYEVPKPRPYVGTGGYESSSRRGEAGPDSPGEPNDYDEPDRFDEPLDNRPDDADSGPRSQDEKDEYARFWSEGRGGGAHASPQGPVRSATPVPPPPGDSSIYRNPPPKRQAGFLVVVAAVIVAAGIAATFLLTQHNPKHPAAGGSPSSGPSSPASSAPAASTPPSVSGASGHLAVPGAIGALRLNSALTGKFVGPPVKKKDANSFFIPDSDVVSGFYTANPAATSFSTRDPRLMFLVAYLSGSGNAHSALHAFLTNHTFTGQQQINPGAKGGVAACGLLPQHNAAPVAHCMWADGDTYADFYSWNSSTSALAKTMIGIRPKVELSH
jgi:hypothetical protein